MEKSESATYGNGRYVVEGSLGEGGMATVVLALDTALGVRRALKILHAGVASNEGLRTRLRNEARVMAKVDHPSILRVYDVGVEGDVDFIVMELAEGGSLQDRLQKKGVLSPAEAKGFTLQVLSALSAAHAAGVVHRDVKPHNVLLTRDGAARLADFGIALLGGDDGLRSTRAGVAMGSIAYMPPEQRLDARTVGPQADVYSAGAMLYALITGGNPVDLFAAAPDSPRWCDIEPGLRGIIVRATRQEPADRYPSARDMALALIQHQTEAVSTGPTAVPFGGDGATQASLSFLLAEPSARHASRTFAVDAPSAELPGETMVPEEPVAAPPARWGGGRTIGALALALALGAVGYVVWRPTEEVAEPPLIAKPPPAEPIAVPEPPAALPEPTPTSPAAAIPEPTTPPSARSAAPPPEKGPAAPASFGTWSGSFGGRNATLRLSGSATSLSGEVLVTFGGNQVSSRVRGSFNEASGALLLEDTEDNPDSGSYEGMLTGERLVGTFTGRHQARVVPFSFRKNQ